MRSLCMCGHIHDTSTSCTACEMCIVHEPVDVMARPVWEQVQVVS